MCEIHSNNELGQNVNETVLLEESRKNNVEIIFNSCFKIKYLHGMDAGIIDKSNLFISKFYEEV